MKKVLYPLLGLFMIFTACSKEEILPENSEITQDDLVLRMAADGVHDVLGFGYDIMGAHLAPKSVKDAVIDMDRFYKENSGRVYINSSKYGYNKYYYGSDAENYLKDLSNEFDIKTKVEYGLPFLKLLKFTATFDANYRMQNRYTYSSKYSFASCDVVKNVKRLYLSADLDLLKNYINPIFIADLNKLTPDEIIKRYGIVVLTDISIGGRLNLTYKSEVKSATSYEDRKITVKAGMNATLKIMNINIDATVTNQLIEEKGTNNESRELYVEYYGGEGTGMSYNLETGHPSINTHSWESSVNDKNAVLTEVDWSKAYPIWEFISNPEKKNQIIEAAKNYINSKQNVMLKLVPIYMGPKGRFFSSTGSGNIYGYASSEKLDGMIFYVESPTAMYYVYPKTYNSSQMMSELYSVWLNDWDSYYIFKSVLSPR